MDALILACVGPDDKLDRFSASDYHEAAIRLGVDAVTTPDDYIYRVDDPYPAYQLGRYARAKARASEVAGNACDAYSVIGLVIGKNKMQVTRYMDFLAKRGIRDQAFPCGDYIKERSQDMSLAAAFVAHARKNRLWDLALGIGSYDHLKKIGALHFSNSEASFGPRRMGFDTKQAFGRLPPPSKEELVRAHCKRRLEENLAMGSKLGG